MLQDGAESTVKFAIVLLIYEVCSSLYNSIPFIRLESGHDMLVE